MHLREVGGGMDWVELAQDRDSCERGNYPSGSIKCRDFLTSKGPVRFCSMHGESTADKL
jgi:hypothetical protein